MNADHRMIFTRRRRLGVALRIAEVLLLALASIVAAVLLHPQLMRLTAAAPAEPCIALYKQGHMTTTANGLLSRDGRGRAVCEVVR
jgi:hypothetical protein